MLDYSDEEFEPQSVRRRNLSPSGSFRADSTFRARSRDLAEIEDGSFPVVATKTQALYKGLKVKTTPKPNPPISEAFVLDGFILGKSGLCSNSNSRLLNFNTSLKGVGSPLTKPAPGDIFPPDYEDHPDSFFKSMRIVVVLAQCFAFLPVTGARGPNYRSLRFKWFHFKTVYWSYAFLGSVLGFACSLRNGIVTGVFSNAANGIIYYACAIFDTLLVLSLSRNWRNMNEEFARMESAFKSYGYPKRAGLKLKIFSVVYLLIALVEHLFWKFLFIKTAIDCAQSKDLQDITDSYLINKYYEVFSYFSYSLWKGVMLLISNFLIMATWNFTDLTLGLISWIIGERFRQIHQFLDKAHGQEKPISFWREVREDYNTLTVLTKRIDSHIQKLMFLSLGKNLFILCIQLLHSFRHKLRGAPLYYFFWSFGYLLLRLSFIAFSAARINDESKEPKTVLYSVPQKNYSAEVRRFLTQITTNEVALTGCGFFSITRSLILTIMGTVITYEIVLVQFNIKDGHPDQPPNGTICYNV